MRSFLAKSVEYAKRGKILDTALRYNPLYYGRIAKLLHDVEEMDLVGRRDLSHRLTERTLRWARAAGAKVKPGADFLQWPILEKEDLREKEANFRNRLVFAVPAATGGTTGVPIRLWRSIRSIAAEQSFIDHILAPTRQSFRSARIAVLRVDNVKPPSDRRPPFGIRTQGGRRLILSSQHVSDDTVSWYVDELSRFAPDILWIYPSAGEFLANHINRSGLKVRIPLVLSSSEILHPSGHRLLSESFQAKVIDYYGLAERTVFASSRKTNEYFLNPAYGRAEFRPVSGEDLPQGLSCADIIATGFWNECMPLVRYRTGDRIVYPSSYNGDDLEEVALGLKPFLSIAGRDKDYLVSPRGELLIGINHLPRETNNIVRMQVIQEDMNHVRIRVISEPAFSKSDRNVLMGNVRRRLPDDMNVAIDLVDALEALPSGKVPYVIRRT